MAVKVSRDICIKMADGSQFCKQSPIRDCGCDRDSAFQDPFKEIPTDLDLSAFAADLDAVLKVGPKLADPASLPDRLRIILTIARLVMLPKDINQSFIISSLDLPTLVPIPTPTPPAPQAQ